MVATEGLRLTGSPRSTTWSFPRYFRAETTRARTPRTRSGTLGSAMKKRKVNPKRRLRADPRGQVELLGVLSALSQRARYGGNPDHKRSPGDFGLTPPSNPRTSKSLCDDAGITTRAEAERLLRRGIELGLVSEQERGGWPQNVWAVAANDRSDARQRAAGDIPRLPDAFG